MDKYEYINEAIKNGDFTEFVKLNETQKVEVMKTWNEEMWKKYHTRDEVTDDPNFDNLLNLIY